MKNKNFQMVIISFLVVSFVSQVTAAHQLYRTSRESLEKNFNAFSRNVTKFVQCVRGHKKCTRAETIKARIAVLGAFAVLMTIIGFKSGWWPLQQKIVIKPPVIVKPEPVVTKDISKEEEKKPEKPQRVPDLLNDTGADFPFGQAPLEAHLNGILDRLVTFYFELVHPAFKESANFIKEKDKASANFHNKREEVADMLNYIERQYPATETAWRTNKQVHLKKGREIIESYTVPAFIQKLAQQFNLMQNIKYQWILSTSWATEGSGRAD